MKTIYINDLEVKNIGETYTKGFSQEDWEELTEITINSYKEMKGV